MAKLLRGITSIVPAKICYYAIQQVGSVHYQYTASHNHTHTDIASECIFFEIHRVNMNRIFITEPNKLVGSA